MGATVTHLPSRVMYFQVSVVDQVLVFEPREPPCQADKEDSVKGLTLGLYSSLER